MDTRWCRGEGDVGGLELCSSIHGVRVLCALTRGTEGDGEREGSGECEGETEREHGRVQIEAAVLAEEVGCALAWCGATVLHGDHAPISTNRWRAMMWVRWEPNWAGYGPIWTLGPKAKLQPT